MPVPSGAVQWPPPGAQLPIQRVPEVCGEIISVFDNLIPLLILFATVLFMLQEPVQRMIKRGGTSHAESRSWVVGAIIFQFLVALYGGYFGAGIGILMLAALGILGYTDIHQMNGLKNMFALFINGVAALYFVAMGMVSWPWALIRRGPADRDAPTGQHRPLRLRAARCCPPESSSG